MEYKTVTLAAVHAAFPNHEVIGVEEIYWYGRWRKVDGNVNRLCSAAEIVALVIEWFNKPCLLSFRLMNRKTGHIFFADFSLNQLSNQ